MLSICTTTLDINSERCQRLLQSVKDTLDSEDYEVIVYDNGSRPRNVIAIANAVARAAQGDYVVLVNDDVILLEGWWVPLRQALDEGAALAFSHNEREGFGNCLWAMTREGVRKFSHSEGEWLDPQFWIWCADVDLRLRVEQAGERVAYVEASRIVHIGTQSYSTDDPAIRTQIDADHERLYQKHGLRL